MLRTITIIGMAGSVALASGCENVPYSSMYQGQVPADHYDDWDHYETYDNESSALEVDVRGRLSGEFGSYLNGSSSEASISLAEYADVNELQISAYTKLGAAMIFFTMTDGILSRLVPGANITIQEDELEYGAELETIGCTGPELDDWTEDYEATSVNLVVEPHPNSADVSMVTFTAHFDPETMMERTLRQERQYMSDYVNSYEYSEDCHYDYDDYCYGEMTDKEILSAFDFPAKPMHITGSFVIIRPVNDSSAVTTGKRAID